MPFLLEWDTNKTFTGQVNLLNSQCFHNEATEITVNTITLIKSLVRLKCSVIILQG